MEATKEGSFSSGMSTVAIGLDFWSWRAHSFSALATKFLTSWHKKRCVKNKRSLGQVGKLPAWRPKAPRATWHRGTPSWEAFWISVSQWAGALPAILSWAACMAWREAGLQPDPEPVLYSPCWGPRPAGQILTAHHAVTPCVRKWLSASTNQLVGLLCHKEGILMSQKCGGASNCMRSYSILAACEKKRRSRCAAPPPSSGPELHHTAESSNQNFSKSSAVRITRWSLNRNLWESLVAFKGTIRRNPFRDERKDQKNIFLICWA